MFSRIRYTIRAAVREWRYGEQSRKAIAEFVARREAARKAAMLELSDETKATFALGKYATDEQLTKALDEIEALPDEQMFEAAKALYQAGPPERIAGAPFQKFGIRNSTRMAAIAARP